MTIGRAYPRIRRAEQAKQLDRATWAGPTVLIFAYDTIGRGVIETELLDFGLVFEGPPFFSYGAEVQPGQALVAGDYPEITLGVKEWHRSDIEIDSRAVPFYLGAYLWISIQSASTYRLRFRLSFEGTAVRNVEYFRG
jgi:hypothetical protein